MIYYTCKICGHKLKTPSGPNSKKHLESKKHQEALKTQYEPHLEHEILLYNAVNKLKVRTYSNILKLFSSFGIKTEITLKTVIKKLRDKDIAYKGEVDADFEKILQIIINSSNQAYPITYSIEEAAREFRDLGYKQIPDLVNFFNELSQKYSEFVSLNSSKLGQPPDFITFKQIFVDQLTFYSQNRWEL